MNTARRVNNKKNKSKLKRKKGNNSVNNYWDELEAALNSCGITYLLSISPSSDAFVDSFNAKKDYWDVNEITRMSYNEELLSRGKAKFPFSFKSLFDLYMKNDIFATVTLIKTNIKYWENPDLGTVLNNRKSTITIDHSDNSYIDIPLESTESTNVFVLSITGMNGITAFTTPFTPLFMRGSVNTENELTVIE